MMDDPKDLAHYNQKRDFSKTDEPKGQVAAKKGVRYLIQKHAARRLHYDFRLELDGVLKSWAVTRGPSLNPDDKRLAVEVEDHPVAYGTFEGTIPKGQYGGGTVMLWDEGWWEPEGDPHEGLARGDLKFKLHGKRLSGSWVLVRMRGRPQDKGRSNWLLIKHEDEAAKIGDAEAWLEDNATSIVSARTMDEIAASHDHVWTTRKPKSPEKPLKKDLKAAKPTLRFREPELATLSDAAPEGPDWIHEVKFDGYRTQALIENGQTRLLTRTGLDWTPKFQPLAERMSELPLTSAILDGEIVAVNGAGVSSFALLQADLSEGRTDRLQYYVFDLLSLDGEDWTQKPLTARKARLKTLLETTDMAGHVLYSEDFATSDLLGHICDLNMEGIISKRADARYRSGRNRNWLKIKCHKRQEFVIGGFTEPTHAARGIGALLIGYYEDEKLIYAGKVGTGFSEKISLDLRKKLEALTQAESVFMAVPPLVRRAAKWVRPELVCEVAFGEWTPDGHLRHPSFQGLREDKPAKTVGRDQSIMPDSSAETAQQEAKAMPAKAGPVKSGPVKSGPVKSGPAKSRRNPKGEVVNGITITHPDRVIYPDTDITKLALADYYAQVADIMLPYVAGRPLSMVRCPEGIDGDCFFQRHITTGQSPHLLDTGIPVKGRHEDYMMIKDEKGLISLVQWGVIELHPWGCMADKPDLPDKIIFDLDPDPDMPWPDVVAGARHVRQRMDEFGLDTFVKTTGGKGLHVVVPLTPKYGWPTIKAFAHAIAESMQADDPARYIATMSKAARKGKIFVDYLRNELTATSVAPYSVRARPGATVATPISWEELTDKLKPADFTITSVPKRLKALKTDPWAKFASTRQTLDEAWLKALKIEF
ncbi:MAG: DNA ligase D [Asticcacaulis sp.]